MKSTLFQLIAGLWSAAAASLAGDVQILLGTNVYHAFKTDLAAGDYVFIDANPAAGSPLRATQRVLGYREVDYKSAVYPTLGFTPVKPTTNDTVIVYDYTAQSNKTNTVGFWAAKNLPVIIGPDGLAYITDGHHTTAGYLAPMSPVRQVVAGMDRVVMGRIVTNYFNSTVGPQPPDDSWWKARAAENNALLIGADGDLLELPGEPGYTGHRDILPSVLPMPTTPSTLSLGGAMPMTPSLYRALTWAMVDGIVASAKDAAGSKVAGYKKSAPGSTVDINFVEFFWADYMRNRVVWDDTQAGSPLTSTNGDANLIQAPLSFLLAAANGIALARSEAYRDQYGRNLSAYTNSALFPPLVVNWAAGSLGNGLATTGSVYNLYLTDTSTIAGEIRASGVSSNVLHVDTLGTLAVTQQVQNIHAVLVNAGGTLKTSWKDTTVSNTTLTLPAGNGTVILDTALPSAQVTVANGTLSGLGSIQGGLTVQSAGTLSPGPGLGTFTARGAVTLSGTVVMDIRKSGGERSNDRLAGAASVTYGGRLVVVATGDPLAAGDAFPLFAATAYSGFFFDGLDLPALAPGLAWDTSRLSVDGVLQVVSGVGNTGPTVSLKGPPKASYSAPASFSLVTEAADADGSVAKVEVFEGDVRVGQSASASSSLSLKGVAAGSHAYRAVVTDNLGQRATSGVVTVEVTATNIPPSVLLASPASGASFAAPALVALAVTTADADDDVARVDYYRGDLRVGTSTNAPFGIVLTNFPVGTWQIRAVAFDANGATNVTPPVSITVSRATGAPMTLQLLHASDLEAGVAALDDAPRFSSVLSALRSQFPTNTLVVGSGDLYIPGPFLTASADPAAPFNGVKGRADITLINAMGFQASCFGNHEFDDNTALVRSLILPDLATNYPGTQFAYLSANLNFATDSSMASLVAADAQDVSTLRNRVARSAIVSVAGQKIGLVGGTATELRTISSPGNIGVSQDLVASIQSAIDDLLARGVNKIVVMTHLQQFEKEFALARQLHDVDILVAGGSHRVFAKTTDHLRPEDTVASEYPTTLLSASGEPVHVVNTGPNYRYVGRLVVDFDSSGVVASVDGRSGAYATDIQGVLDTGNAPADPTVVGVLRQLAGIIDGKDGNRFGRSTVYLNGLRASVRTEETNLGDLTADANLFRARQTDPSTVISIKNGGGIRDSIGAISSVGGQAVPIPPPANPRVGKGEGEISQLDIENSLRFNNTLSLVTVTAQQLRDTIEWGVAASGTPGQFPHVAGISFSYNPTNSPMTYNLSTNGVPLSIKTPGERLRNLVVMRPDESQDLVVENGVLVGDPARRFRVVTLNYMAGGGDSYLALSQATDRVDLVPSGVSPTFNTDGSEQKALADYLAVLKVFSEEDRPAEQDARLQNLSRRGDWVLVPWVRSLGGVAGGAEVRFRTLPGRVYALESKEGLDGPWTATGLQTGGNGALKSLVDTRPGAEQRYYRVVVVR